MWPSYDLRKGQFTQKSLTPTSLLMEGATKSGGRPHYIQRGDPFVLALVVLVMLLAPRGVTVQAVFPVQWIPT